MGTPRSKCRNFLLVLGDQLDFRSAAFEGFDEKRDFVWMAEVADEATHVWCHQLRIAFFFSAMRHFRDELEAKGRRVVYTKLPKRPSDDRGKTFAEVLSKDVRLHRPEKLVVVEPGDYRVLNELEAAAGELGLPLEIREDTHFYETVEGFEGWAKDRKTLVLETYYRHMRKKHGVLMTAGGDPVGGDWNFDKENRESFGRGGPPDGIKAMRRFSPDKVMFRRRKPRKVAWASSPSSGKRSDAAQQPQSQSHS